MSPPIICAETRVRKIDRGCAEWKDEHPNQIEEAWMIRLRSIELLEASAADLLTVREPYRRPVVPLNSEQYDHASSKLRLTTWMMNM